MATTKPGEIRCPTCHRSTPPAAYCTQCGAPLPSDTRVRPRGMDREELQERIRARRTGGDPYRRGALPGEEGRDYQPFEPSPEDAAAQREAEPGAASPRIDHFDDSTAPPPLTREPEPEEWPDAERWSPSEGGAAADELAAESAAGAGYAQPAYEPPGYQADPHYEEAQPYAGPYADDYAGFEQDADAYPYAYEDHDAGRRAGGGGGGALAVVGFLALGVLALLAGAFLANLFGGGGVGGEATPTPSVSVAASASASVEATVAPSASASAGPSGSAPATDGVVIFPDGVIVSVEACATSEMGFDGCAQPATTITGGAVWAWMAFGLDAVDDSGAEHESEDSPGSDSLVLTLRTTEGDIIDQQPPRVLNQVPGIDCPDTCAGYLIQGYQQLGPGEYEFVLERNGEFADRSTFTVEG